MSLGYYLNQDGQVARWVAQMLPYVGDKGFGACSAIGVVDVNRDNELIAGLVYHNLSLAVDVIELTLAALPGKYWMTRTTLDVMGHFPFIQCGCQMLVTHVPATDLRSQRQLAAYGFMLIMLPRYFGRHADGVRGQLTDDDWKASKFNKRFKDHVIEDVDQERAA